MSVVEKEIEAPASSSSSSAVVVRFAGDSGDGMQLTGSNFTEATALHGNDLATFLISLQRSGRLLGLHLGFQHSKFTGADEVTTAGDDVDVLVAMNPAALITNLKDLLPGGLIVADADAFTDKNLVRAGYKENPLEDGSLDGYRLISIDITKQVIASVEPYGLSHKFAVRCKNMWTLGLVMWLFDRDRTITIDNLKAKFKSRPEIADANVAALNAGHSYGETAELPTGSRFTASPC